MVDKYVRAFEGPLFVMIALSLSGCQAIEFIFKAGVWSAVIGIAVVAAIAFAVVRLLRH